MCRVDSSVLFRNYRYDPTQLSDIQELIVPQVTLLGYRSRLVKDEKSPDHSVAVLNVAIQGMTCSSCVFVVERALTKYKGVKKASVTLSTNRYLITLEHVLCYMLHPCC